MKNSTTSNILIRYLILILLSISNLYIFYKIFTPLTFYPVFTILNLFSEAKIISENTILLDTIIIQLIPACIAGAAYYFLLILNLSTPMPLKKRLKSILFLFSTFLIMNILRIIIFTALAISNFQYFDIAHNITWHLGSTLIVIIIWFANIFIFKISQIPIYTDIKNLHAFIIQR